MFDREAPLGIQIQRERLARGLTQQELADALGLRTARQVQWWENGGRKPHERNLQRLCEVLSRIETVDTRG